jgi:hypothetical protein
MIIRATSLHYGGIRLSIGGYHLFSGHGWEIIKMVMSLYSPEVRKWVPLGG